MASMLDTLLARFSEALVEVRSSQYKRSVSIPFSWQEALVLKHLVEKEREEYNLLRKHMKEKSEITELFDEGTADIDW
ncbi:hypothetical protein 043JT007_38 [Bacillus phage 043JT007]|nr:hypothetical protein 043JT007_38 [Bacillus phage 043JT007]